jgi:hypothetical protein
VNACNPPILSDGDSLHKKLKNETAASLGAMRRMSPYEAASFTHAPPLTVRCMSSTYHQLRESPARSRRIIDTRSGSGPQSCRSRRVLHIDRAVSGTCHRGARNSRRAASAERSVSLLRSRRKRPRVPDAVRLQSQFLSSG